MKKLIVDDKIVLIPMTSQLYHIERKNYIADPMMCETPYIYTPEIAQKDFERKANNCNRVWFAILLDDIVIGDVYLKNIDLQKGSGTLSIVLIQNCYKEKGYGTAVERTVLEYGFKELGLSVIYADVVLRNTRSQHVLEKIGFEYLHEVLWSSIFVTLMANKIGGLQFGIYRNCQISSRVFHTAVAALPLTKANRSDFE